METYLVIGGIGSGKSTVARLLARRGAGVVDLDACGHEALRDPEVIKQLIAAFGEQVAPGGVADRAALAREAFAAPERTARLNEITHPAIWRIARDRLDALEREGRRLAVVEASAYAGPQSDLLPGARIIAVRAPEDVRIARAVAAGWAEDDVRARIAAQPTDDQRAAWADVVIDNTGTLADLDGQLRNVLADLKH